MYLPESAGWLAALGVPAVLWAIMDRTESDPIPESIDLPPPRPRPMPVPPAEDTVDYPPGGEGGHREPARPPSKGSGPGSIPGASPRRYGTGIISGFSTWVSSLLWGDPDTGGGLFGRRKPR